MSRFKIGMIFALSLDGFATAHRPSADGRFKFTRDF